MGTDQSIPNTKEIIEYLNCAQCLIEIAESHEPIEQDFDIGWTELGFQVWCSRHNVNLIHIDFEGHQHPVNMTCTGGKKFTEEHRKMLLASKVKIPEDENQQGKTRLGQINP